MARNLALATAGAAFVAASTPLAQLHAGEPEAASYFVAERVNLATDGTEANEPARLSRLSGDGRYVIFSSTASNLVPGDTNGYEDVFVRDLLEQTTTRVSVRVDGVEANDNSSAGNLSPDGRFATFSSDASNLVAGDDNGFRDVFRRDLETGEVRLVSVGDLEEPGDDDSSVGSISEDGTTVGFISDSTNLVASDTNGERDVFVRDIDAGTTTRASVASDGSQGNDLTWIGPVLSPDGTMAAFSSYASNLVLDDTNGALDVFLHHLPSGTTQRVNIDHNGQQGQFNGLPGGISTDNRYVMFSTSWPMVADDTNNQYDVFRRDLHTGTNQRVTVADDEAQTDLDLGGNGYSMSRDGWYGAFSSDASNLVPGDTNGFRDIFVRDMDAATTSRIQTVGEPANDSMASPSISDDGGVVAFSSPATNLVPGDTNGFRDVFVARRVGNGEPSLTATLTADQTRVAVGQPVDHHLTITNTGDTTLTGITVTAPDLPDCEQPVADLSPAATHTIDCTYIPTADDIGTVTTHATIHTDQTAPVTTNTVTVAVRPNRQPDLEIKKPGRAFIGDDTYNHDAAGQTATATRYPGRTATFYTRITNDGTAPARYQIIIPTPLPTGTRLYQGRTTTDLTTAITNHTYTTPRLTPGDTLTIRIETTAAPTGTATTTLRATTTGNHVPQHDTTTATLTTR